MLFIPHISANTQARHEGYFRLEWELAAERAMSIASGVAFILPIIIDATREPDALVPDRFRKVQWTRLPGGEVTPEVLQRFVKRWAHRAGVGMVEPDMARVSLPVSPNDTGQETRATPKVGRVLRARRLWATAVLLAVLGAGGTFAIASPSTAARRRSARCSARRSRSSRRAAGSSRVSKISAASPRPSAPAVDRGSPPTLFARAAVGPAADTLPAAGCLTWRAARRGPTGTSRS